MAAHESPRTTKLYNRTRERLTGRSREDQVLKLAYEPFKVIFSDRLLKLTQGDSSMTGAHTYVISLPEQAQGLLVDNGTDLVTALRNDGLEVNRGPLPAGTPSGEGGKEIIIALVAVGVTATMVASGITKILDALGRNKKFLATEYELAPVLDGEGKAIKHATGEPVLYLAEKKRLIEATQVTQGRGAISAEVRPTMLKITASSGK